MTVLVVDLTDREFFNHKENDRSRNLRASRKDNNRRTEEICVSKLAFFMTFINYI